MANIKCPQCASILARPATGSPICPSCNFGAGRPGAQLATLVTPGPGVAPAAPAWGAAPQGGAYASPFGALPAPGQGPPKNVTRSRIGLYLVGGCLVLAGLFAYLQLDTGEDSYDVMYTLAGLGALAGMIVIRTSAKMISPAHRVLTLIAAGLMIVSIVLLRIVDSAKPTTLGEVQSNLTMALIADSLVSVAVTLSIWKLAGTVERSLALTGVAATVALGITLLVRIGNITSITDIVDILNILKIYGVVHVGLPGIAALVAAFFVATRVNGATKPRMPAPAAFQARPAAPAAPTRPMVQMTQKPAPTMRPTQPAKPAQMQQPPQRR